MSPFRVDPYEFPNRAKIQFTTSAEMPGLIYRACLATGAVSNTVYCQHAIATRLAEDLGIPLPEILGNLPTPRGPAKHLWSPDDPLGARYPRKTAPVSEDSSGGVVRTGPANTVEEVREYR